MVFLGLFAAWLLGYIAFAAVTALSGPLAIPPGAIMGALVAAAVGVFAASRKFGVIPSPQTRIKAGERLAQLGEINEVLGAQLKGVTEETEKAALQLTEGVDGVETEVKKVTHAIDQAASHGRELEENFAQSTAGVEEVEQFIEQLLAKWQAADEHNQELLEMVMGLGEVTDVIKSISKQTDVLALNASIEAANAGEQGKGFAVVAEEVRTMSSRTTESAEQIEARISEIQAQARKRQDDASQQAFVQAGREKVEALRDGFSVLEEDFNKLKHHHEGILTCLREANEMVEAKVTSLLADIQFQDITRQQIDQVVITLEKKKSQLDALATWLQEPRGSLDEAGLEAEQLYADYVMDRQRQAHHDAESAQSGPGSPQAAPAKIELF